MNTQTKIDSTASLSELAALLNACTDTDHVDMAALPVFGERDVNNTSEVFSWDDDNILVQGSDGFTIDPRCSVCGEAEFHCNH